MNADGLIRRARDHQGITQGQLAGLLGVNPTSVSDAERRGDTTTVGLLARYGEAMGLTLVLAYRDQDGKVIE
jgi:transcriptional regulator with XRE-family HTH domain